MHGSTTFAFPFVTIDDVMILDANTLLVVNDNNFHCVGGRGLRSDNTEFLRIHLSNPVLEPGSQPPMVGDLAARGPRRRRQS